MQNILPRCTHYAELKTLGQSFALILVLIPPSVAHPQHYILLLVRNWDAEAFGRAIPAYASFRETPVAPLCKPFENTWSPGECYEYQ